MNNYTQSQSGTSGGQDNRTPPDKYRHALFDTDTESSQDSESVISNEDLIQADNLTVMVSSTNKAQEQDIGNELDKNVYESSARESVYHVSVDSSGTYISSKQLMRTNRLSAMLSSVNVLHTINGNIIHVSPGYEHLIFRILRGEKRRDIWPIYKLKKIHRHRSKRGEENTLITQKGRYPIVHPRMRIGVRSSEWLFRLRYVNLRAELGPQGDSFDKMNKIKEEQMEIDFHRGQKRPASPEIMNPSQQYTENYFPTVPCKRMKVSFPSTSTSNQIRISENIESHATNNSSEHIEAQHINNSPENTVPVPPNSIIIRLEEAFANLSLQ